MDPDFVLHRLKLGDKEAFNFIFRNYYRGLVLFAMDFVRDQDKAEEIVEGVFIKLWEDRDKIVVHTSLKSYLLRSVQNKCLDIIKHEKIREKYSTSLLGNPSGREDENGFISYELKEKIEITVNSLPGKTKEIFKMSRFENKKYREIAEALNISVKTVEASMGKALAILRKELKDWL